MLLYYSFLSDGYRGQCNKTCFISSITELVFFFFFFFFFIQNKHNLKYQRICVVNWLILSKLWVI